MEKSEQILEELYRVQRELKEVTDFIRELQAMVIAMADNPMLKTLGFGGITGKPDLPKLPGM